MQTIPRTVLFDNATGTHLLQWPVEEIEDLRLNSTEFSDVLVEAGTVVPLDIGTATQVCLSKLRMGNIETVFFFFFFGLNVSFSWLQIWTAGHIRPL